MPVVDVDRVSVAYPDFDKLVDDLRRMAATNILSARSRRPLGRAARDAAREEFARKATAVSPARHSRSFTSLPGRPREQQS